MKTTVQLLCMLCNARLFESDEDSNVAAIRVDEQGAAKGWKRIGESDVCKACGELACNAFMPACIPDALNYTFNRIRDDVNFFYVMNFTECQRRVCVAIAELTGKPLAEVEKLANTPRFASTDKAREEVLRERIAELES